MNDHATKYDRLPSTWNNDTYMLLCSVLLIHLAPTHQPQPCHKRPPSKTSNFGPGMVLYLITRHRYSWFYKFEQHHSTGTTMPSNLQSFVTNGNHLDLKELGSAHYTSCLVQIVIKIGVIWCELGSYGPICPYRIWGHNHCKVSKILELGNQIPEG